MFANIKTRVIFAYQLNETNMKTEQNLSDYIKDRVYKDKERKSRWRLIGSNYTFSSKREASMVAEREYERLIHSTTH